MGLRPRELGVASVPDAQDRQRCLRHESIHVPPNTLSGQKAHSISRYESDPKLQHGLYVDASTASRRLQVATWSCARAAILSDDDVSRRLSGGAPILVLLIRSAGSDDCSTPALSVKVYSSEVDHLRRASTNVRVLEEARGRP